MKRVFTIAIVAGALLAGCSGPSLEKEYGKWPLKPFPVDGGGK